MQVSPAPHTHLDTHTHTYTHTKYSPTHNPQGVIATESGAAAVKLDGKYASMAAVASLSASNAGAADAAWDD